jgi:hypothetical protein
MEASHDMKMPYDRDLTRRVTPMANYPLAMECIIWVERQVISALAASQAGSWIQKNYTMARAVLYFMKDYRRI